MRSVLIMLIMLIVGAPCIAAETGTHDADQDGLPDEWERRFGLDPASGSGIDGASGDPDLDGLDNAKELLDGTHPRGFMTRYLAEAATGTFFDTRVALFNAQDRTFARVQLRFLLESGGMFATDFEMPPCSHRTVDVDALPGLAAASFAIVIDSDAPVVVERTMAWAAGQETGAHAERAVSQPSPRWYFAEGVTHGPFDVFYLIQNPDAARTAWVHASFLLSPGPPIERVYQIGPNGRLTLHADEIPGLAAAEFAAVFTSTEQVPVIVERSMYLSRPGAGWIGGDAATGASFLASRWYLAEGATGSFFETFILIGNPNADDVGVLVQYRTDEGVLVERAHTVPALGRLSINVALEAPDLADTIVSTIVQAADGEEIVVERAMWWPAGAWHEGHVSIGSVMTSYGQAMAGGIAGGPSNARTYVLILTADGPNTAPIGIMVVAENGLVENRIYYLAPNRRYTFDMEAEFPALAGQRFGMAVRAYVPVPSSPGFMPLPFVAEHSIYHDAGGITWRAGTNVGSSRMY